jgi:hypothetical protein
MGGPCLPSACSLAPALPPQSSDKGSLQWRGPRPSWAKTEAVSCIAAMPLEKEEKKYQTIFTNIFFYIHILVLLQKEHGKLKRYNTELHKQWPNI